MRRIVSKQGRFLQLAIGWLVVAGTLCAAACADDDVQPVRVGDNGKLVYERDEKGNQIPDFSHCGYAGADRQIPVVPVAAVIEPIDGDDRSRIQAAIDAVAKLPQQPDGFRGAVLLQAGTFEVGGNLRIDASGIVLRGSGAGEGGTVLVAAGTDRRALIRVEGVDDRQFDDNQLAKVIDEYMPVGARRLQLDSVGGLRVGDRVLMTRPSTAAWIKALGMEAFGVAWKPGTRDIHWDRTITRVHHESISIDAPITTAIEKQFGGATVARYRWPGRIANVGIEDLRLQSAYAEANLHDEEHAWFGVVMNDVEDGWIRRAEFHHFAGGAVSLLENTQRITVEDCISLAPISELGGYRRHTFFTQGQLTLFLRCWSGHGRHDFAVGHASAGPNAFVNCFAAEAHGSSSPVESWASAVLYDNVRIDGADLNLENRWASPPGAGWAAANCVLWQCRAATARCFRPPTANNWAIGMWAEIAGDGTFAARSDFVEPISLYQAQLAQRRDARAAAHVGLGLVNPVGSTSPTLAEAAKFVGQSNEPARQMVEIIRERFDEAAAVHQTAVIGGSPVPLGPGDSSADTIPSTAAKSLSVENGWLVIDGKLKTGGSLQQPFWRGTIRPGEAAAYGPALTRFVPGRDGTGFTDDLAEVADTMVANHIAVFDHHYGLWYDRRRDDHLMVRRADGAVAPPFYEQPFARTGRGTAWDGLSKYDLTKFNPWYWNRLREFAGLADERGLVLFHQNYFQHNLLEAGAHWADSPWRPANNVNDTDLLEPPPYIGDKRIFLAHLFYDVSDPRRRALHRGYIRQCLDAFAGTSNVIQMTSAEYTGPLEFTRFWIDTIVEWEAEQKRAGRDTSVLIGLSATKDVQDAILADPERGPHIDVIDIRYWCYMENGRLYAPEGGKSLAPRQHMRQLKPRPSSFASIVRAVREYRTRYPDKAVTYYADQHCRSGRDGWAVVIGGGSLPNVKLPTELAKIIPTMRPLDGIVSGENQWCLANGHGDYLIGSDSANEVINPNLPTGSVRNRVDWIDAKTGELKSRSEITPGQSLYRQTEANVLWLRP
jgi:Family of unknown function (DUF6298)